MDNNAYEISANENQEEHACEKIIMPALNRIGLADKRFLADSMAEYGFSGMMHRVLSQISAYPDCSQDDMAWYMAVDKATVTRTVDKLENAGLITRSVSEKDRRCKLLRTTEKGEELVKVIKEKKAQWRRILFEGVSQEELELLSNVLTKLLNNAERERK